jgi:DNA replication protein DnaC
MGATGTSETDLERALAHKACLEGFTGGFVRLSRLLNQFALARADGTYGKLVRDLAKTDVDVREDWRLAPITPAGRHDLLEILDDRHGHQSTIVTSLLPVGEWHASIGDATLADAILDRLEHNARGITLKGDSMRRRRGPSSESVNPNA